MSIEAKAVYFESPGITNTDEVLRIVKKRAKELGIKTVLVASTSGDTGAKAVKVLSPMRVIVISLCTGSREANVQQLSAKNRKLIESKGGIILTATHAFGGLGRAMHQAQIPQASSTYVIGDIVANTLRIFGHGMKVVCEIAGMAADAGLVSTDESIIAIAGTGGAGRGADTAVVLQPANVHNFFEMRVREILCKPHF
ncbi:MAG: pyruvate kinase alpha/beta domain-containing protein [Chloroflexota bacterium]